MNFDDAVRTSPVIRDEHRDALLEHLKRIPEFSWLVGLPNRHIDRLQGDFIGEFPIVFLRPDGSALSKRRPVMVINNTCDLPDGQSSFVSVAPVLDLEKYLLTQSGKREHNSLANYERDIRKNKVTNLFYIPHLPGFHKGAIVRLDMICSVSSELLAQAVSHGNRLASFTQSGFYLLLMKLNYHFVRSESAEVSRLNN